MILKSRAGVSLIETAVMVVVMSMIGVVVGPALEQTRHEMRSTVSSANLQQIGQGGAVYGFANRGRLFGYSWRSGETYVLPDGRVRRPSNDQEAASYQNLSILMERTGRMQGQTKFQSFSARLPHRRFSHLVLFDFMGLNTDDTLFIDPSDKKQLHWAANPLEYLEPGNSLPYGDRGSDYDGYDADGNWLIRPVLQRWAFATSYQNVPASWLQDYPNPTYQPVETTPHLFIPTNVSGTNQINLADGREIFDVRYPGQKVWMHEEFDREQGDGLYFAYDQAQSEKLMFDLSVNSWASGNANSSRAERYGLGVWRQTYVPLHQFPLPVGGLGDQTLLNQRYRWTFRGLKGVDYGHAEPGRGPTNAWNVDKRSIKRVLSR